jgi:hypothetical protein
MKEGDCLLTARGRRGTMCAFPEDKVMSRHAGPPRRRSALLFAAALLPGVIYLSVRGTPPAPAPPAAPDAWHVPELLAHLAARGVRLHAEPVNRTTGELSDGAYLCEGERPWEDVAALPVCASQAGRWRGVVLVLRSRGHSAHSAEEVAAWGESGLRAGPFVFFGDGALLRHIAAALAE